MSPGTSSGGSWRRVAPSAVYASVTVIAVGRCNGSKRASSAATLPLSAASPATAGGK